MNSHALQFGNVQTTQKSVCVQRNEKLKQSSQVLSFTVVWHFAPIQSADTDKTVVKG